MIPDDSPEYLAEWAGRIVKATPLADLRSLYAGYRRQACNPRLSKMDRRFARRRAVALQNECKQMLDGC